MTAIADEHRLEEVEALLADPERLPAVGERDDA